MGYLSIINERGPATWVANPIYPLDPLSVGRGAEIGFEVLEADADRLKTLIGEYRCFYINVESGAFWAQLKSLEPTVSTHPGLAGLRNEPTLRGDF
jgi:hypothetical protein